MSRARVIVGDARAALRELPPASVHACVTSPPYLGLRAYTDGEAREIGREATPAAYVAALVAVFREVRRVLRDDGTLWLNLGDSYAGGGCGARDATRWPKQSRNDHMPEHAKKTTGLAPKNLIGVPWLVAFALQADGWFLRAEIIWHKLAPMPESVRDRPTKAHEQVFLLSKRETYYYDADAIAEPAVHPGDDRARRADATIGARIGGHSSRETTGMPQGETRNKRSVWTLAPEPYAGAHFAVMPTKLVIPCVQAGTSERGCCPACGAPWRRVTDRTRTLDGAPCATLPPVRNTDQRAPSTATGIGQGRIATTSVARGWTPGCACGRVDVAPCTVLDPFAGSGTVGAVAIGRQRAAVLVELNPAYAAIARARCLDAEGPLFAAYGDAR